MTWADWRRGRRAGEAPAGVGEGADHDHRVGAAKGVTGAGVTGGLARGVGGQVNRRASNHRVAFALGDLAGPHQIGIRVSSMFCAPPVPGARFTPGHIGWPDRPDARHLGDGA